MESSSIQISLIKHADWLQMSKSPVNVCSFRQKIQQPAFFMTRVRFAPSFVWSGKAEENVQGEYAQIFTKWGKQVLYGRFLNGQISYKINVVTRFCQKRLIQLPFNFGDDNPDKVCLNFLGTLVSLVSSRYYLPYKSTNKVVVSKKRIFESLQACFWTNKTPSQVTLDNRQRWSEGTQVWRM